MRLGDRTGVLGLARVSGQLTLDGLARLAAAGEKRSYASGERLMTQGEAATSMWVILSGKVDVVREHPDLATPIPLATLGPGQVVGEMGLFDGDPRSATVTAAEPTVAMEIPENSLSLLVAQHPDVYSALVKVLTKRLRDTNELVAQTAVEDKGSSSDARK